MFLDFVSPALWSEFQTKIHSMMGLPAGEGIWIHRNFMLALRDLIPALMQAAPQRREAVYLQGFDPALDWAAVQLSKEGFRLKGFTREQVESDQWDLGPIDLCFMVSADDPLLGRRLLRDGILEKCEAHRIFFLELSHSAHFFSPMGRGRHHIGVYSLGRDYSLVKLGERAQMDLISSSLGPWQDEDFSQVESWVSKLGKQVEQVQKICEFESRLPLGAKAYFDPSDRARLFDRAVFYWEDMDGTAFIEQLSDELGQKLQGPGGECGFETTSLSRWGGLRTMDWLKGHGLSSNQIRGLVILSHELINEGLVHKAQVAREKVLKLQSGECL